ncbi:histone-lysine N-methyltransferase SETMAR [Trichonephila clavipes]|nr:histone-lysine N-methyltransferase SETMAR [Trichonephila clavipes]
MLSILLAGIFDVKIAPRTGRAVVENVDKITEIIEVDRHVNSRSLAQELKIDHKTVLSHLRKVGFKKKPDVWVPHQLTPKNMMDRFSICEALAKPNEIDPFLKQIVTLGIRNGSHATILCENDRCQSEEKQLKW